MVGNHLLAEIRPEKMLFFFHTLPFPLAHGGGEQLCCPHAVMGSWEDVVPQAGWGSRGAPAALGGSLALLPATKTYFSWETEGQEGQTDLPG